MNIDFRSVIDVVPEKRTVIIATGDDTKDYRDACEARVVSLCFFSSLIS